MCKVPTGTITPLCRDWLDDPVTQAVMQADRVDATWLAELLVTVANTPRSRQPRAHTAEAVPG